MNNEEKKEEDEGEDRKWIGFVKRNTNNSNKFYSLPLSLNRCNNTINFNYNHRDIVEMEKNIELEEIYSIIANSEELLIQIFGYLPYRTLCQSIVLVCCKWKRISEDNQIWLNLCNKYDSNNIIFSYLIEERKILLEHLNEERFLKWSFENCYHKIKKRVKKNKFSFEKTGENFKKVFEEELILMSRFIEQVKYNKSLKRLDEFDTKDGVHICDNHTWFNNYQIKKLNSNYEIKQIKNNIEIEDKIKKLKYNEKIVKNFINNGSIHYPSSSFQSFHYNEDPNITLDKIRNSFKKIISKGNIFEEKEEGKSIKIAMIGPGATGKTNFINQFINSTFDDEYDPTIG